MFCRYVHNSATAPFSLGGAAFTLFIFFFHLPSFLLIYACRVDFCRQPDAFSIYCLHIFYRKSNCRRKTYVLHGLV